MAQVTKRDATTQNKTKAPRQLPYRDYGKHHLWENLLVTWERQPLCSWLSPGRQNKRTLCTQQTKSASCVRTPRCGGLVAGRLCQSVAWTTLTWEGKKQVCQERRLTVPPLAMSLRWAFIHRFLKTHNPFNRFNQLERFAALSTRRIVFIGLSADESTTVLFHVCRRPSLLRLASLSVKRTQRCRIRIRVSIHESIRRGTRESQRAARIDSISSDIT